MIIYAFFMMFFVWYNNKGGNSKQGSDDSSTVSDPKFVVFFGRSIKKWQYKKQN